MMSEWSDRLPSGKAAELWNRAVEEEVSRRTAQVERELRRTIERAPAAPAPAGFYEAMGSFLKLRDKLFPDFPADPAWKILVTLAQTPPDSPKASVTGVAHGADVPMATAIRYIAAMETQGIVERVPHPGDKRQVMIRLTTEGQRRLDTIADKWALRLLGAAIIPATLLYFAFRAFHGA
jgi:hypothetical protein